ncbi:ranBP-type and C3HC4-type zinc finger-containing protein 1 [Eucyclogobius newberryi]|uniref:ranBP-type and C3HC4-type zinc finger-containing protein 1 n=1 Tax=Eucyclogobius newberryi TaxID=166745 RepID=UPI003B5C649C
MTTEVDSNLKKAEELAESLSDALSSGDGHEAARLSHRLSELSVPVSVSVRPQAYPRDSIRLKVGVEDGLSDTSVPVTLKVSTDMTIAQLKEKINVDFGFHPLLQRWVIGKRLAKDSETLYGHGIRQSGDQVFLFLLSATAAHFTKQQHKLDHEQQVLDGIMESMHTMQLLPRGTFVETPPQPKQGPPIAPKPPKLTAQDGWACPQCTFVNKPTRPGCEICSQARPEDYEVPNVYTPDPVEIQRMEQEELAMLLYEEAQVKEREQNYLELIETDNMGLIPNQEEVDCPICITPLPPLEGVVLRECLHTFCRECLVGTIVNSQDAEVACADTSCDSKLLDREIKALLTEQQLQRFLELRLSIAESRSEHSFHCQTANCPGWCIHEDEVNEFHCDICDETNCILCRAIHKDMNCKDYQEDLRIRAENDQAAQKTKQMVDAMLQNGEAMKCPRCKIIVQKKDGCDWICCVMCRTEICWVTKQARWGPNGRGDTSGGCKCRLNQQPCHPNCQNCH